MFCLFFVARAPHGRHPFGAAHRASRHAPGMAGHLPYQISAGLQAEHLDARRSPGRALPRRSRAKGQALVWRISLVWRFVPRLRTLLRSLPLSPHRQARRPQDRGDDAQVLGAVRQAVSGGLWERVRSCLASERRGGRKKKNPLRSHHFTISSSTSTPLHSTDTFFCVDKSVTAVVIQGLAEHKEELGAPLCPCR